MRNLTMLTDLYELTMMYGYWKKGMGKNRAVFDMFYRATSEITAYAIAAGLEQVIEYVNNLHFAEEDIAYLRSLNLFDESFLDYLSNFKFTGDIMAVPEGTICIFLRADRTRDCAHNGGTVNRDCAAQHTVNHQTLIATKAGRVVQAADGGAVLEFGLRRAQGPDAGIYGARAAVIAGCQSTSNVLTGEMFGIPLGGTHAHSWVMSFPDELTAFRAYAEIFPTNCMLLVDTYDTLGSGMPNAIKVFGELRERGYEPIGIRLDSGDLAYLSRECRRMLDEAGYPNAKVCASGDLDEEIIWDLNAQGAAIDVWGVGTKMITSQDCPALGGVYKLAAEEVDGQFVPKIKISENPAKITNPGQKMLYRLYDKNGMAAADLIALDHEVIDESQPLTIFDPVDTWKKLTLTNFKARKL